MKSILSWTLRLIAAAIVGQSLFFKFSGADAAIALFTQLDMEPEGRYLIGSIELIAIILLLLPQSAAMGALLGMGVMAGAIIGHVTKLGFSGEMGILGAMAILVFLCCAGILYLHRQQIPLVKRMLDQED